VRRRRARAKGAADDHSPCRQRRRRDVLLHRPWHRGAAGAVFGDYRAGIHPALIGDIAQTPLIDVILGDLKASTPAASTRWGW